MSHAVPMVEIWRGPLMESVHTGHAVICDASGGIVESWGDPQLQILPRSASKMIQALPLLESGAAETFGLKPQQLALACSSHNAAAIHTNLVSEWLGNLTLCDDDFRCGPRMPKDQTAEWELIRSHKNPCQMHNVCSGKHSGFLTLAKHLGAGPEYVEPDHPVQRACLEAYESVTGEDSPGHAIDGCSAPNFITTLHGMARAMAFFASARDGADARQSAAVRLWQAMVAHPEYVAGEDRSCTDLMRACKEPVALKTGAEAIFIAIIPGRKLGIAIKISDGNDRGSECAIAAILVKLGVIDADHPLVQKYMNAPITNYRGITTGMIKPAAALL